MNTNAATSIDLDKQLEELVTTKTYLTPLPWLEAKLIKQQKALAAALLRARKREHEIHSYADGRQVTAISVKDREAWRDIERMTRGKDAELEELLK